MASYEELRGLVAYTPLRHKIEVAIADVAVDIYGEATPVAERLAWASTALDSPAAVAQRLIHYVLIQNKAQTAATIQGASDAAIKTNIADAVAATVAPAA